jgi:cell division protein FtsW
VEQLFWVGSANYYLLAGVTLFMVIFGLAMVLSASSVDSYIASDNFFVKFWKQGMCAIIGVPLMFIASRMSVRFWKRWSVTFLAAGCALQLLVIATPLGVTVGGNRNWLELGSLPPMQPSEAIKVAIAIWLGAFLATHQHRLGDWKQSLLPPVLVIGTAMGLVTLGGDLGTTLIMGGMVFASMYFANVRAKHLVVLTTIGSALAIILAVSRPSRLVRILATLHPSNSDYLSTGWQLQNGYFALARGGIFGVGLGNSHEKWAWLPSADTDFIFAIIGEELGVIGAILVLVLFGLLALGFLRVIRANTDPFIRSTTAGIFAWIIGQAFVNIGVVLGVLPGLGVPLPLISAGGTALITSLLGIGIVLSFARNRTTPGDPETTLDGTLNGRLKRKLNSRSN